MPVITDTPIAAITHQQRAILDSCVGLMAAISARDTVRITECRAKLSGLLHANLADEEAVLDAPIRRMSLASRPIGYSELTRDAAELRGRYSAHVGKWTVALIDRDVVGYERDVRRLVGDLESHLKKKIDLIPQWMRQITAANPVSV